MIKIIKREVKKVRKKRNTLFKRIGHLYYKNYPDNEQITATCIDIDHFKTFDEIKNHAISLRIKNLPICIVGDCKYPPLPFPIFRYYLKHNPKNFIGEEFMGLYDTNAFLVFHLNYPEDYDKVKHIMHRTVYLGSSAHIMLICHSEAVLSQKKIRTEDIDDYNIILLKDTNSYLPYHKKLKTFTQNILKKL